MAICELTRVERLLCGIVVRPRQTELDEMGLGHGARGSDDEGRKRQDGVGKLHFSDERMLWFYAWKTAARFDSYMLNLYTSSIMRPNLPSSQTTQKQHAAYRHGYVRLQLAIPQQLKPTQRSPFTSETIAYNSRAALSRRGHFRRQIEIMRLDSPLRPVMLFIEIVTMGHFSQRQRNSFHFGHELTCTCYVGSC